ncbi:UNVERIFIED_CONTAM: hypothetical protein FKN15_026755 [Acipenser sinensis]
MQPPRATASEDNAALRQFTYKPAGARPDYRGRWCAVSREHPARPNPPSPRRRSANCAPPLGAPVHGRLRNSLNPNSRRPDCRAHPALHIKLLYWMCHCLKVQCLWGCQGLSSKDIGTDAIYKQTEYRPYIKEMSEEMKEGLGHLKEMLQLYLQEESEDVSRLMSGLDLLHLFAKVSSQSIFFRGC